MAGRLSDADIHAILDFLFGSGANALAPAEHQIALSSTQPTNTGTNVSEPVGNGYSRVIFANNATNWAKAASRVKKNAASVTFPTATGSWGSPGFFAVYRNLATPVYVAWGNLASAQAINAGVVPTFHPGDLTIAAPGT